MHLITTPIHCQKFRRFRLRHKLLLYLGMGCLFNKQTNQPQIFSSSVCCTQLRIKRGNFFSSSLPSSSLSPLTPVSPTLTSSSSPPACSLSPSYPPALIFCRLPEDLISFIRVELICGGDYMFWGWERFPRQRMFLSPTYQLLRTAGSASYKEMIKRKRLLVMPNAYNYGRALIQNWSYSPASTTLRRFISFYSRYRVLKLAGTLK